VLHAGGEVLRGLSEKGLGDWHALAGTRAFERLVSEGKLVGSELLGDPALSADPALRPYAGVVRHERVPFVSYPYEWPFSMLRDAALLQLEVLRAALADGLVVKDASPYNVQWRGAGPVFVDVGSFERLPEGEPWAGYRQFCMLFLYPLLLGAYAGVDHRPLLRGRVDGIPPAECAAMLRGHRLRRGVATHVLLHARLERRYGARSDAREQVRAAGFNAALIDANARRLERLVRRLDRRPPETPWGDYAGTEPERKAAFVREALAARRRRLVWDVGCNDGRHSRIAAEHADTVVALDADAAVVDRLYRDLRAEGARGILPLAVDVADPSPGLGWRLRERLPLEERGRPDLVLCLAVVHHLVLGAGIPLAGVVDWLRSLDASVAVELVGPDDPRAAGLMARKRGAHPDYSRRHFEAALGERFDVERTLELAEGRRVLYLARPRV
jgi:SAM-dependent methyltransferase